MTFTSDNVSVLRKTWAEFDSITQFFCTFELHVKSSREFYRIIFRFAIFAH